MAEELKRISFDEFARNPVHLFNQVIEEHEAVIVENEEEEGVEIRPLPTTTTGRTLTEEDYQAFRSAFGGWADVDTATLKKALYKSRQVISTAS